MKYNNFKNEDHNVVSREEWREILRNFILIAILGAGFIIYTIILTEIQHALNN